MLELSQTDSEALIEKNRPAMERIWIKIKKEKNLPPPYNKEDYIRYIATDPRYLYEVGFVYTTQFSFEEWEKAFEPYKQVDGTYLISKNQFIALGKYKAPDLVKKPLDPMKLREGWYDTHSWHEFCVKSVIPSTTLTVEQLVEAEKKMKDEGQIVDGKILVDKQVKLRLKFMLDNFPSPARRRELAVAEAYENLVQEEITRSQSAVVKTTFVTGQKVGDTKKKDLKETLMKASKISNNNQEEKPSLSLKDLQKKSTPRKTSV